MNKHLHYFLDSFKVTKAYWTSLLVEGIGVSVILLLLTFYSKLIEARTLALTGGLPVEQLKMSLLQATPEVAQAFATNVKIWVILLIGGSIIVALFSLFLFSYTQAAVWNLLLHKKIQWKKAYLRWSGMTLVLLMALLFYLLIYTFIRLLANSLAGAAGEQGYMLIISIVNGIFIYAFLLFIFLTYYSFVHKNKVWESIGDAFSIIRSNAPSLGVLYLLSIIVGIILSFLSYYLQRWMLTYPPILSMILSLVILVLFYTWMRFYLLKIIQHGSH